MCTKLPERLYLFYHLSPKFQNFKRFSQAHQLQRVALEHSVLLAKVQKIGLVDWSTISLTFSSFMYSPINF